MPSDAPPNDPNAQPEEKGRKRKKPADDSIEAFEAKLAAAKAKKEAEEKAAAERKSMGDPPGMDQPSNGRLPGADQTAPSMGDPPLSGHAPPKTVYNGVPSAHPVQCRCCGGMADSLPHEGCKNPNGYYEIVGDGRRCILRSPTGARVAVVSLDAHGNPTSEDPSKEGTP